MVSNTISEFTSLILVTKKTNKKFGQKLYTFNVTMVLVGGGGDRSNLILGATTGILATIVLSVGSQIDTRGYKQVFGLVDEGSHHHCQPPHTASKLP